MIHNGTQVASNRHTSQKKHASKLIQTSRPPYLHNLFKTDFATSQYLHGMTQKILYRGHFNSFPEDSPPYFMAICLKQITFFIGPTKSENHFLRRDHYSHQINCLPPLPQSFLRDLPFDPQKHLIVTFVFPLDPSPSVPRARSGPDPATVRATIQEAGRRVPENMFQGAGTSNHERGRWTCEPLCFFLGGRGGSLFFLGGDPYLVGLKGKPNRETPFLGVPLKVLVFLNTTPF